MDDVLVQVRPTVFPFPMTCRATVAKRLHKRVYFGYVKVSGGDIFEVKQ